MGDAFLLHHLIAVLMTCLNILSTVELNTPGAVPRTDYMMHLLHETKWAGGFILFVLEIPGPLHHINRFEFIRSAVLHKTWMVTFMYSRFLFFIHLFINHIYRLWPVFFVPEKVDLSIRVIWSFCALLNVSLLLLNLTWVWEM